MHLRRNPWSSDLRTISTISGILNQTSLTFSLISECERGDFFGLEATALNLRTKSLKHGKNNKYPMPRIKGAATSHPNNCQYWYKTFIQFINLNEATEQNDNIRTDVLISELKMLRISTTTGKYKLDWWHGFSVGAS